MTTEAGTPPGFWERIEQMIERGVAAAMRAAPLRNSSISENGSLTIRGGLFRVLYRAIYGGGVAVEVGDQHDAAGNFLGTGLSVQGPDGTDMIIARQDALFGNTRVDIYDAGGRIIFGSDAASEQGLARPYLNGGFAAHRFADFRYSTTSATFETVESGWVTKQHPRLRVTARASMDTSGETGELRVLVDGVQLGATTAEAFAITTRDFGPAHIAGSHMQRVFVEIQGRRTSAAGALRIEPMGWESMQS